MASMPMDIAAAGSAERCATPDLLLPTRRRGWQPRRSFGVQAQVEWLRTNHSVVGDHPWPAHEHKRQR